MKSPSSLALLVIVAASAANPASAQVEPAPAAPAATMTLREKIKADRAAFAAEMKRDTKRPWDKNELPAEPSAPEMPKARAALESDAL